MSRIEKLIKRLFTDNKNWSMRDVEKVVLFYNMEVRRSKSGGSHVKIKHQNGNSMIIPDKRPIKPVYINSLAKFIKENHETH